MSIFKNLLKKIASANFSPKPDKLRHYFVFSLMAFALAWVTTGYSVWVMPIVITLAAFLYEVFQHLIKKSKIDVMDIVWSSVPSYLITLIILLTLNYR